jgi:hypothetical protein
MSYVSKESLPRSLRGLTFNQPGGSVREFPLYKDGEMHQIGDEGSSFMVSHEMKKGEDLGKFLKRLHPDGVVLCDCNIFAQLLTTALDGSSMILLNFGCNTDDRPRYLMASDEKVHEYLQQSSCQSKGMWVVPTSYINAALDDPASMLPVDQFVAMTSLGPQCMTKDQWGSYLTSNVYKWAEQGTEDMEFMVDRSAVRSLDYTLKKMVQCMLAMGRVGKWNWQPTMMDMLADTDFHPTKGRIEEVLV